MDNLPNKSKKIKVGGPLSLPFFHPFPSEGFEKALCETRFFFFFGGGVCAKEVPLYI